MKTATDIRLKCRVLFQWLERALLFLVYFVPLIENSYSTMGLEFSKIHLKQKSHHGYHLEASLCSAFQCLSSSHTISVKRHGVTKFKLSIINILLIGIYLCKIPFQRKFYIQIPTEMLPPNSPR